MKSSFIVAVGVAVSALVWVTTGTLPNAARWFTAVLVGVLPALSILQARAIGRIAIDDLPPRNQLYFGTIAALWALAFATAFIATNSQFPPELLGVALLPLGDFLIWFAFSLIAAGAIVVAFKALGMSETREIQYLIPRTLSEKVTFVLVCITAGICEELIFRGFLIAALRPSTGSVAVAGMVAAAAFGAAHAHQNISGGVRAALLGVILTVPLLMTGSLYPAIAAHTVIDLLGGLWLHKWLLRSG